MMKKKLLLTMTASVLAVSMLFGCGKTDNTAGSKVESSETTKTSEKEETPASVEKEEPVEEVTLKYFMLGPVGQEDAQMVYDEFNERLQELVPGVTVEFETAGWADYKQRILLAQAGGEQMDIVGTYLLDFESEVANGTFIELDDLLAEYGQETVEAYPDYLWGYGKVDGKIYEVPAYQQLTTPNAMFFPSAYNGTYIDLDALQKALWDRDFETVWSMCGDYAEKLTADGKCGKGMVCPSDFTYFCYECVPNVGNFYLRKLGDKQYNVEYYFTMPELQKAYKVAKEWYDLGYIREDVLTATDKKDWMGKIDGYVMFNDQENPIKRATYSEWDAVTFDAEYMMPSTNVARGVAITSSCKYPEKAMQVINILHSDAEMYNLLTYGIEGTHYEKVDETHINVPYNSTQAGDSDKYGLWRWIVGNTELTYLTQVDSEEMQKYAFETINSSENVSDFVGFVVDKTNIADQLNQINAIKGEYMSPLTNGVVADVDKTYAEWEAKLKAAGIDEVIAELQKQVDEFLANK